MLHWLTADHDYRSQQKSQKKEKNFKLDSPSWLLLLRCRSPFGVMKYVLGFRSKIQRETSNGTVSRNSLEKAKISTENLKQWNTSSRMKQKHYGLLRSHTLRGSAKTRKTIIKHEEEIKLHQKMKKMKIGTCRQCGLRRERESGTKLIRPEWTCALIRSGFGADWLACVQSMWLTRIGCYIFA